MLYFILLNYNNVSKIGYSNFYSNNSILLENTNKKFQISPKFPHSCLFKFVI